MARARGRSTVEVGTMAAKARPAVEPMSASNQRPKARVELADSSATIRPCTPAWVMSSGPTSSAAAMVIEMPTMRATCHQPIPSQWTMISPTKTPTPTPTVISRALRSRWPWVMPSVIIAATGANRGTATSKT